jgi:hypothetical protein
VLAIAFRSGDARRMAATLFADRRSSFRGWAFAVLALGAHVALYAALGPLAPPPRMAPSPAAEPAINVDFAIEPEAASKPSSMPRSAAPTPEGARPPFGTTAAAKGAAREKETGAAGPSVVPELEGQRKEPVATTDERPLDTADGNWSFPATQVDVTSRKFIAGALVSPSGETAKNRQSHVAEAIAEALDAHDAEVGVTRGGDIALALENAVSASSAPFEGTATFDIGVDTDGHVSTTLLNSNGNAEGWSKVGDAARAGFDPRRIRIPPGARGWHTVVRVEAKVQYPNGLDPKTLGTKVEASPTAVQLTSIGKVCSVRITIGLTLVPIMGGCDPSNLGSHTLRVIHASIVNEGRF